RPPVRAAGISRRRKASGTGYRGCQGSGIDEGTAAGHQSDAGADPPVHTLSDVWLTRHPLSDPHDARRVRPAVSRRGAAVQRGGVFRGPRGVGRPVAGLPRGRPAVLSVLDSGGRYTLPLGEWEPAGNGPAVPLGPAVHGSLPPELSRARCGPVLDPGRGGAGPGPCGERRLTLAPGRSQKQLGTRYSVLSTRSTADRPRPGTGHMARRPRGSS